MSQTTNFGIVLPEGTDTFNPLTFNNNAFTKVDQVMKANQDRGITTATHTFIDGINTILRNVATCNTLVFVASSDYVASSTIAVDGVTMTFRYADGTTPKSGAFRTNQAVMCYINGTILTMISAGNIPDIEVIASDVSYDNAGSQLEATNVQDAIDEMDGKIKRIGEISTANSDSISLPNNTGVIISSIDIEENGVYIIEGITYFGANSNGDRGLSLSTASERSVGQIFGANTVKANANSNTGIRIMELIDINNAPITLNLFSAQTSGAALTVITPRIKMCKIK